MTHRYLARRAQVLQTDKPGLRQAIIRIGFNEQLSRRNTIPNAQNSAAAGNGRWKSNVLEKPWGLSAAAGIAELAVIDAPHMIAAALQPRCFIV